MTRVPVLPSADIQREIYSVNDYPRDSGEI